MRVVRELDWSNEQFNIDEAHQEMDLFSQQIVQDVWRDKYAQPEESSPEVSLWRVAKGICRNDTDEFRSAA